MTNYAQSLGLELRNVDVARGGTLIVRCVNLIVHPGEIIQLFGPNGSGKTSLLQTISGLTPVANGEIMWRINDEVQTNLRPANLMSFIGHHVPAKAALNGIESLQYWAEVYGAKMDNVGRLLEQVGLQYVQSLPTGQFSAGQKRRLDIARCLMANRPLWLLDEPTASLDTQSRALWIYAIERHQENGGSAIISTHDRLELKSRDITLG